MDSMMPHSSSAPDVRHVFVYGTLRRGGRNDIARYAPKPTFVARAALAGTLYDLGTYPGAVLGGDGCIQGEVYRITAEVERELDVLEEVNDDDTGEYLKRERTVRSRGASWECLVYEIQPDRVVGMPVIASGDWMQKDGNDR